MWVYLARPQWNRSCTDCQKYVYDDAGQIKKNQRTGLPLINAGGLTPCVDCEKIPHKVYDEYGNEIPKTNKNTAKLRKHAVDMTPQILQAWRHYRECRAVNDFPKDHIVRANAVLFSDVDAERDRQRQEDRENKRLDLILDAIHRGQ